MFGTAVPLSANATDNIGVVGVQFKIDNVPFGAEDTISGTNNSMLQLTLGTPPPPLMVITLSATARDSAGNTQTATISVTVNNVVIGGGDTTDPVISGVTASTVGINSATITWTTDEPTTGEINYGLTTGHGDNASSTALVTNHNFTLSNLTPNSTYHYSVSSVDASGNGASASSLTFQTLVDPNVPPPGGGGGGGGNNTGGSSSSGGGSGGPHSNSSNTGAGSATGVGSSTPIAPATITPRLLWRV